ncbi:MAG: DUF3427 domain-containing protein, partial [Halieaceae bacterium]|nr:DUF3427 domain-containing protein [Halieaceae bacterium]
AFQQAILDDIAAEREAGLRRHLVVAATGTGKTMVAAFDYRRFAAAQGVGQRPSLLFVAHREEILEQAMQSFRHVLRDATFGDLLVGGSQPTQQHHLFCSVQSWHARSLADLERTHFDYVVLDEAHHAAANTYQRLLEHVRPRVLLGLTATPERADGRDIRDDFGRQFTHELRLGDAIEARHLVPFHYFGVSDAPGVDFRGLAWSRGGYRTEDLDRIIGGNERRAGWVLRQLEDHASDLGAIRALGFCASQAHATFMAAYCNTHGLPAEVLTADSPGRVRQDVQRRLVQRDINIIFTVDLFNEGVDIPEVDTVLFLRPTESLTVYVQQLGRGLRLCEGKAHLTVLDFIAPQHRRFRFADRFRALTQRTELRIDRQLEAGFPWLPAGCLVRLDKQATATVLHNIRDTLAQRRPQVVAQLAALKREVGPAPSLAQILDWLHLDDADLLLKHGLPSTLLGATDPEIADFERGLVLGLRQLLVADDREVLLALQRAVTGQGAGSEILDDLLMLGLSLLWAGKRPPGGWREALGLMRSRPALREDLSQVLEWRLAQVVPSQGRRFTAASGPLAIHCRYTSEQILLALGMGGFEQPPSLDGVGVKHIRERKLDAFFVTIDKSEKEFSPTTRYEDYAMSSELFHWQSQSGTSPHTPVGQRYINHQSMGYQPLLFVREARKLSNGLTEPFRYIGPVSYIRHEGSKPMSIVWRLHCPLPARELGNYRRQVI